jgi:hypothetical protein
MFDHRLLLRFGQTGRGLGDAGWDASFVERLAEVGDNGAEPESAADGLDAQGRLGGDLPDRRGFAVRSTDGEDGLDGFELAGRARGSRAR